VHIPYTYLAVLLVFTLLTGVVIGDRLAANADVESSGGGRSGGCSGLASARLHDCVHRHGHLKAPGKSGQPFTRHDADCDPGNGNDQDD
jgi:hypothetical protein